MVDLKLDPVNVVLGIALVVVVYIMFFHNPPPPPPPVKPIREPMGCAGCNNTLVGEKAHGYNSGPAKDVSKWEASCNAGLLESCLYHTNPHDAEKKEQCRQIVAQECANSARKGVSPTY